MSGRADLKEVPKTLVWGTKSEVPIEGTWESRTRFRVHHKGHQLCHGFSDVSVVIVPVMILRELGFKLQSFIMILLTISI